MSDWEVAARQWEKVAQQAIERAGAAEAKLHKLSVKYTVALDQLREAEAKLAELEDLKHQGVLW